MACRPRGPFRSAGPSNQALPGATARSRRPAHQQCVPFHTQNGDTAAAISVQASAFFHRRFWAGGRGLVGAPHCGMIRLFAQPASSVRPSLLRKRSVTSPCSQWSAETQRQLQHSGHASQQAPPPNTQKSSVCPPHGQKCTHLPICGTGAPKGSVTATGGGPFGQRDLQRRLGDAIPQTRRRSPLPQYEGPIWRPDENVLRMCGCMRG